MEDVRIDLMRGQGPDGKPNCTVVVRLRADALRRLGLHPDQPTSVPADPLPPKWWGLRAR
ncbi:hypothetical protein [Streptacidiphilus jiangxiensis]|uniref:hypothetical protein n=1 Tax=Streptacidiphilus jiangxiensis TaxID=235985 RepID=UPI0005AB0798|nr:hypothetical protein [Streptacidiphilus jiangxiensis]